MAKRDPKRNAFYAQSGGVTAVINATAAAVIEAARAHRDAIGKLYAGRNGILGALREELFDTGKETSAAIAALEHTPGGAFGSCRYKLKGIEESRGEYERLIAVFRAHDIGYFFYNGGNDSADTALKISRIGRELGYPLACIGIPKTVDNDLAVTDCSPGFGSVAKYVAVSTREAALDVASMAETSTKVFILEVMGRHAGWIAAAAGLAGSGRDEAPHLILFPERPFERADFLKRVDVCVKRNGYCVVVASEGVRDATGNFLSEADTQDAFGHAQLGGLAPRLAGMVADALGYKYHWAVADYLQRSARHIASATDLKQAVAVGRAAVEFAVAGENAVMPVIERTSNKPYRWRVAKAPLARIANHEKKLPKSFIRADGYGITAAARRYLAPLVAGEAWPPFKAGLPVCAKLKLERVPRKLPPWNP
ncbi:MAG: 6-phosphofructokinase [Gammaproteobacteria bacterium]